MKQSTLYRYFDADGTLIYLGISSNAMARLRSHKKDDWANRIATVKLERFPDRSAALAAESMAIKAERPMFNKMHLIKCCGRARMKPEERCTARGLSLSPQMMEAAIARAIHLGITFSKYVQRLIGLDLQRNFVKR